MRMELIPGGLVAAYDPARETRQSVWAAMVDLFGPLRDVTPASVVTA
jgi:hypothetical protein